MQFRKKHVVQLVTVLSVLAACVALANAELTIDPTFANSIASDPNAAVIEAGIDQDIATIDSYIANNVTVNITFQEGTTGLGESSTNANSITYAQYVSDLQTKQNLSSYDNTAIASLGTVPPSGANPVNGTAGVWLTQPLLRALGEAGGNNEGGTDGTITLNTSIMNLSRTGTLNPGFYDLMAVAQHEIDEVLCIGGTGSNLGGGLPNNYIGPLDLYRYSAPGVRSYSTSATSAYFSIDGGNTKLVGFNQVAGADYSDWGSNAAHGNTPPQVQDAFATPGSQPNLGPNELIALDVVGLDLTAAGTAVEQGQSSAPVPSSFLLMLTGLAGLVRGSA